MAGSSIIPFNPMDQTERIRSLEEQIEGLERDLAAARQDAHQARQAAQHAVANLRRQLSPLYGALQQLFGDMDSVAADTGAGNGMAAAQPEEGISPRVRAVWESWKNRLTPNAGKFIDALLTHTNGLNSKQLSVVTGVRYDKVARYVHELNNAGLIDKAGGVFTLKKL